MKIGTIMLGTALLAASAAWADEPKAVPLVAAQPVKITAAEAAGPIFSSKAAVKENGEDGPSTDVLLHDPRTARSRWACSRRDRPITTSNRMKTTNSCSSSKEA